MESTNNVFIAGGGTGGHVYPAISVAEQIQNLAPQMSVHFVGTRKGLEFRVVPEKGYPLHLLSVGMFNKNVGLLTRLITAIKLPLAFIKSLYLLLKYRPKFVLGVGGYVSVPMVLAASILGFKTYLWEPNAFPGMANRFLSKFSKNAFIVFENSKKYLKCEFFYKCGIPIRKQFFGDRRSSDKKSEKFHIFVFGGSQGAKRINDVMSELLQNDYSWLKEVVILHQTGPRDFDDVYRSYQNINQEIQVDCVSYVEDMKSAFDWADLVICRSGAGSIAELSFCKKACILIPYPYAADNHQQKNAEALVEQGAAVMILQKKLFPESLSGEIQKLMSSEDELKRLRGNIFKFHIPDSAKVIAEKMLDKELTVE